MTGKPIHRFQAPHPWRIGIERAAQIQAQLGHQVVLEDDFGVIDRVAGVDVGFEEDKTMARAAVVVLSYPSLTVLESAVARRRVTFPYVPGYLSFREVPAILSALGRLRTLPDLVLCDGQGYAHPRRFGLACHLGVITGIACIGVAKTRLIGEHRKVKIERGSWAYLTHRGERIGAVLRTRRATRPVYVSAGHRIGLRSAMRFTLACCPRYRLPETTRLAHRLASR